MMKSTSDAKRSMTFKTFLKLTVLVASQLFSLFILYFGGMVIGYSCSSLICDDMTFFWFVGGLTTTIVFHTYLAFRVGISRRRNGRSRRTWEQTS